MIADLSELHNQIHQGGAVRLITHGRPFDEVNDTDTVAEVGVVGPLTVCQVAEDIFFNLVPKFLLHILLDTTEHEGLQDHVKTPELVLV